MTNIRRPTVSVLARVNEQAGPGPQSRCRGQMATSDAHGVLPPGWVTQVSRSTGAQYWFNTRTGASSYTRPATGELTFHYSPPVAPVPAPAPAPAAPAPGGDRAVALAVASAYDHLADQGREGRRASSILHLKNFNNWVKAVLIAEHAPRPCPRVLDLACGKLGDLAKWRLAGARTYCGVDISTTAVADARRRFNETRGGGAPLGARLARADLGVTDLEAEGVLAPGEQFDAISCQFALHYLFQSEARALAFFRNIAGRLAPGGVFLGTLPDAAQLVRRAREALAAREAARAAAGDGGDGSGGGGDGGVSFGNAIYSVTFPRESLARQFALGGAPYGLRYDFYLAESVEHVDEYLVPWELLVRLAGCVGLVPVARDNFHDWFRRHIAQPGHRATARTMRVLDCEGTLSPAEWEAAGLYRVFAFVRPAEGAPPPPPPAAQLPPWEALLPRDTVAAYAARAAGGGGGAPRPLPYKAHLEPGDVRDTLAR